MARKKKNGVNQMRAASDIVVTIDSHNLTSHQEYTKEYIKILDVYQRQIDSRSRVKNGLKIAFFIVMMLIFGTTVGVFSCCIIKSFQILRICVEQNGDLIQTAIASAVSVLSSFSALIFELYKIPSLIAQYLFDKEEDQQFVTVISQIQSYEKDMVQLEKASSVQANIANQNNDAPMDQVQEYTDLTAVASDMTANSSREEPVDDPISASE